ILDDRPPVCARACLRGRMAVSRCAFYATALVSVLGVGSSFTVSPLQAQQTVKLAQRQFAANSPAAPFQGFFSEARRLAASTTPAWASAEGDLSAWGPALIFALLDRSVATETVLGLGAPLEAEATAPVLLVRTLGLYAAKS